MIYIHLCGINKSDRRMTLIDIYAPNKDDPAFITELSNALDMTGNDDRILAGDFNCVLQDNLDKKGGAETHANRNMKNMLSS